MSALPAGSASSSLDIQRFRRQYFGPLIALLLALKAIVAVVWLGMSLPVQWDLSFPEGAVVARGLDVARGDTPYHDWVEWPHGFAPYGPLTYYPAGWVGRLLGGDDPMESVRLAGRLQSQVSLLGLVALSVALLRRMKLGWGWALLGASAALGWESLFAYVVSYRPDGPQVFFSVLALYLASGGRGERLPRAIAALAALYVSFWFKATSWGVLAALTFWLWRGSGPWRATLQLAAFALAGLVPVAVLDAAWDGRLLLNLVGSLDNGVDFQNFVNIAAKIPLGAWLIFILGGAVAVIQWLQAPMDSPVYLLALGTLCSVAASLLATLKVGADMNYYLEPFVLCGAWTVYGVWNLWELPDEAMKGSERLKVELRREIPLTILLLPFLLFICGSSLTDARGDFEEVSRLWREPAVVQRIKTVQGPVLSVFPCLALEARGEPGILDHYQYRVLADRGLLKRSELLNRLRRREFDAIVVEGSADGLAEELYLPEFGTELFRNYEVSETFGETLLYLTPRTPRVESQGTALSIE